MRKLIDYLKGLAAKLVTLRDTPHAIAGGVAIGVFIGFTPLFGVKTLLSLGVAYLLRCNPIAAVIAVSLHDVALPIWPVILRMEYDIGFWVFEQSAPFSAQDGDAPHPCWGDVEMDDFFQSRAAASDRVAFLCCSGGSIILLRPARDSEGPTFS